MTLAWFCLRTKPRREVQSRDGLEQLGVRVYLPMVDYTAVVRGKLVSGAHALFPSHLFVALEPLRAPWRAICAVDGVDRPLSTEPAGAPREVPWRAISIVQAVEGELREAFQRRQRAHRLRRRSGSEEADRVIEALKSAAPWERPGLLLDMLEDGRVPRGVVIRLADLRAA